MTPEERSQLIDQLDRSFTVMPNWVKSTVKHAMGAPRINPGTGQPFRSFREVIEAASDDTLVLQCDHAGELQLQHRCAGRRLTFEVTGQTRPRRSNDEH